MYIIMKHRKKLDRTGSGLVKENCSKITEKEDLDSDDDLDDENWYLKYAARWSVPIEVTGGILLNPVELTMYLKSRIHAETSNKTGTK
jgi:hypothetical protein